MRVTYNWLKDFVEIKIAPKALADKLTMAGLEVTALEERQGDFVFEIEVTSNRPDCLSVMGIAREVAAITDKKLKFGSRASGLGSRASCEHRTPNSEHRNLEIKIEDKRDCPLYTGKIIKDVKVGPSPEWLKKRLELVGSHSVNNIVDITNYVLFTYGEPLHAFDWDRLFRHQDTNTPRRQLQIMIRRAKDEEKIATIDGEERILDSGILVIADNEKSVAIAGVMGGKDTEVTEATKNILLEAAIFNPIVVRHGRQKLGLQSESSYRFERGIDLEIVEKSSWQAVKLIQELAGGRCALAKTSGLPKTKKKNIQLNVAIVNKTLGINIAPLKIRKILNSLGFKIETKAKNTFSVEIPAYRLDVNLEIDLIEEIARIFGYGDVPKSLPQVLPQITTSDTKGFVSLMKNILGGLGLNEVVTYSLIDKDLLRNFASQQGQEAREILNPLSKEQEVLRPTIIPSLSRCAAYNLNQKEDYINIFEIAKVFPAQRAQSNEELVLGIALSGAKSLLLEQGLTKDEAGLLHLKGILEVLFGRLSINEYKFNVEDNAAGVVIYIGKEKIGIMKKLQRDILNYLDIKNKEVFVAELSLDRLFPYIDLKKRFVPLPIYPSISRDISLILKEEVKIGEALEAVRQKAKPLLRQIKITDYYKGKQIPAGFKGITISCLYRSDERTLTEEEINPIHSLACAILVERFQAQIR